MCVRNIVFIICLFAHTVFSGYSSHVTLNNVAYAVVIVQTWHNCVNAAYLCMTCPLCMVLAILHAHVWCTLQSARTAQDYKEWAWRVSIDFRQCLRSSGERAPDQFYTKIKSEIVPENGKQLVAGLQEHLWWWPSCLQSLPNNRSGAGFCLNSGYANCYNVLHWASSVYTDNTLYSLDMPHLSVHVTFCSTLGSASRKVAAAEKYRTT